MYCLDHLIVTLHFTDCEPDYDGQVSPTSKLRARITQTLSNIQGVVANIILQIHNLIVFILGMQISNISPLLNLTTLSIFLEFVQLHPQIRFDYFCAINKHKIAKNYLKRK